MPNKFKYALIVGICFVVSIIVTYNIIDIYKEKRVNTILINHTDRLQTFYEILQYNQNIMADVAFDETLENRRFMKVLKSAYEAYKEKDFESFE